MKMNKEARTRAIVIASAAALGVDLGLGASVVHAQVTGNANYSATVETATSGSAVSSPTGTATIYKSTSFEAAGYSAPSNTPSNIFPAYGVVAFNTSSYAALASSGVSNVATFTASEYTSTSTSTGTQAGSIINFYFAESPTTSNASGGAFNTGLEYNASSPTEGFDAANYTADLVGTTVYTNAASVTDTVALTLSAADVSYVDSVLSGATAGEFELFAVAGNNTSSGRYDGSYTGALATLTLDPGVVASPEPTSALLLGSALTPMLLRRRRNRLPKADAAGAAVDLPTPPEADSALQSS